MPIYEYRCPEGHLFERFQSMTAPAPERCDVCEAAPVELVLYPVAIHYKGSGFYSTDYGKGKAAKTKESGGGESGSGGSSGSSDPRRRCVLVGVDELDRLVGQEDLLRRLVGRSRPGAGRPSAVLPGHVRCQARDTPARDVSLRRSRTPSAVGHDPTSASDTSGAWHRTCDLRTRPFGSLDYLKVWLPTTQPGA